MHIVHVQHIVHGHGYTVVHDMHIYVHAYTHVVHLQYIHVVHVHVAHVHVLAYTCTCI